MREKSLLNIGPAKYRHKRQKSIQTDMQKNRKIIPIQVYPVYDINRTKDSQPTFSDMLTIRGANIMISMKTIRQIPAFILKAKATLALRNI